jgi:ABC transporter substrate binding protein
MRRRQFIAGLGSAAVSPVAARAQQREQARRIGVLMGLAESDPEGQARIVAFRRALQALGWTEGRNIQVDYRWAGGDIERTRLLADELVQSAPDVIVVNTPPGSSALRQATSTIPIVFVQVLDLGLKMQTISKVKRSRQIARRSLREIAVGRDEADFRRNFSAQSGPACQFDQIKAFRILFVSLPQQQHDRIDAFEKTYGIFLE